MAKRQRFTVEQRVTKQKQKMLMLKEEGKEHLLQGNYERLVVEAGLTIEPGKVARVQVLHDDWCDLLNNRGPCNCNPVVKKPEPLT